MLYTLCPVHCPPALIVPTTVALMNFNTVSKYLSFGTKSRTGVCWAWLPGSQTPFYSSTSFSHNLGPCSLSFPKPFLRPSTAPR